jgi:hypothetical protein
MHLFYKVRIGQLLAATVGRAYVSIRCLLIRDSFLLNEPCIVFARFRLEARRETPYRYTKKAHHYETQKHCHSGGDKRARRRVF